MIEVLKRIYFHTFFFESNKISIGKFRFIFFIYILILCFNSKFSYFSLVPKEIWDTPYLLKLFRIDLLSFNDLKFLGTAWKVFLFFSAIGFLTKFSTTAVAILSLILLGLPKAFLSSDFQHHLPLLVMCVFATSKCGDNFSVDCLLFKNKKKFEPEIWAHRLILFCVVMVYFSSAIAKLRYGGMSWFSGELLAFRLPQSFYQITWSDSLVLKNFISEIVLIKPVMALIACGVFLLEFLSPLAMTSIRQLKIWIIIWIVFHFLIFLFMGIYSSIWYVPIFIGLYPWRRKTA